MHIYIFAPCYLRKYTIVGYNEFTIKMKKLFDSVVIAYYTSLFAFFPIVTSRLVKLYYMLRYKNWKERHQEWYHRKQAEYCRLFMCKQLPYTNVEIINTNNEQFERPAIIIANHQSILDIPAIFMLYPKIVGMAKEALFHNVFFRSMAKYKELVSNAAPVRTVVTYVRKKMSEGFSFLIFPEGTRSSDLSILPFRAGAFFFAESLKCDIIPVTIYGTGKVLNNKGILGTSPIVVEIGKRESYSGMDRKQMATYWHDYFVKRFEALSKRK